MAALSRRALKVAPAKVGPDFIDPSYHSLATGRPGRNLDSWICGASAILPMAAKASVGADLLLVEGVMGLFDGARMPRVEPARIIGRGLQGAASSGVGQAGQLEETPEQAGQLEGRPHSLPPGSTAEIAAILEAPVVLVVDASSMSTSVGPLVNGFKTWSPSVELAGVILNRVSTESHELLLRDALKPLGIPVLGALQRDEQLMWSSRHLGLVPVAERAQEVRYQLDRLAFSITRSVDLDALVSVARSAPPLRSEMPPRAEHVGSARIAVATGRAFSFTYQDNLERLGEAGAELIEFDPLTDDCLPPGCSGLYAGGGFPEIYASELAANLSLNSQVREELARGMVVWAECGGMLWLSQSLDNKPMCAALPAEATVGDHLVLGYRVATTRSASPLAPPGSVLVGHEFHYCTVCPPGDALYMQASSARHLAGYASPTMMASFLHLHLGADPKPAESFVISAALAKAERIQDELS